MCPQQAYENQEGGEKNVFFVPQGENRLSVLYLETYFLSNEFLELLQKRIFADIIIMPLNLFP